MSEYENLKQAERSPRPVTDHSPAWAKLPAVADCNGTTGDRIRLFCEEKHITVDSLTALGTSVIVERNGGGVALAWGHTAHVEGREIVSALKFRPLGDKQRYAAEPSTFIEPIIVGARDSLDWFLAEGETDTARLFDLIGDVGAIMLLPAGALTFKPEWAAHIPRGATVHLAHDADEAGDQGAGKAARIIGGRTVRIRPPRGATDWCEWPGDRDAFIELVRMARSATDTAGLIFSTYADFANTTYATASVLLGDDRHPVLARGTLLIAFGPEGASKSTLATDLAAHLCAGVRWLDLDVPTPVRVLMVENEGAPGLYQSKVAEKVATWQPGTDWEKNLHIYREPWGRFTFADELHRQALRDYCTEHAIALVIANPLLGTGGPGSGRPDETQAAVEWLKECGLGDDVAFWWIHHVGKSGDISGDWGRQPDTLLRVERDGDRPQTILHWKKVRWSKDPERPAKQLLAWRPEDMGYDSLDVDLAGGIPDEEIDERLTEYLAEHGPVTTNAARKEVKGAADRIRARLQAGLDEGRFDTYKGARGAVMWFIAAEVEESG